MSDQPRRLNVLWLMSDQHNARCAGFAGHPVVRTPNLDELAAEGTVFTNAYANNPVCSPSRISFLTGQYVHMHGCFHNYHFLSELPNPITLPTLFRASGWQTALVGKSHTVRNWDIDGFERVWYTSLADAAAEPLENHYFAYLHRLGIADNYEERYQIGNVDGSVPGPFPYEQTMEHFAGDRAIEYLESRDAHRPFFLKVSFQRPHDPLTPAPELFDMYDPDHVPLPENVNDARQGFPGRPMYLRDQARREMLNDGRFRYAEGDAGRLRRALASYFSLITAIDVEIGRIVGWLRAAGEWDNTVVLYTSDHGDFAGDHGLMFKGFGAYDAVQRIPFLIRYPEGPSGATCDHIIESVDLYPTLCELCGIPLPKDRDGSSIVPLIHGENGPKDAAFCEAVNLNAVRTDSWRLVYYPDTDEGELYDYREDPFEVRNRYDDPACGAVRERLLRRLLKFTMRCPGRRDAEADRISKYAARMNTTPERILRGHRYSSLVKNE